MAQVLTSIPVQELKHNFMVRRKRHTAQRVVNDTNVKPLARLPPICPSSKKAGLSIPAGEKNVTDTEQRPFRTGSRLSRNLPSVEKAASLRLLPALLRS